MKLDLSAFKYINVYNRHSKKDWKLFFKTNYRLMQVKIIAECSKGSIPQYFRPSLSYHYFVIRIFILSIFEWLFYTGFIVYAISRQHFQDK